LNIFLRKDEGEVNGRKDTGPKGLAERSTSGQTGK
jgi:hypothetical protein